MSPDEPPAKNERLLSLDVYRGTVMLLLATSGLGLAKAAKQWDGAFAEFLVFNGSHPQWNSQFAFLGVSVWDLIQPAFMFIVGVSMPFSYEKRARLGQSYGSRMRHAWTRAILLTLLGVFLQSRWGDTNWLFTNVLSQIGLGYGFLFFLFGRSWKTQFTAGAAVLVVYYILMVLLPRGLESWRAHFADGTSLPQQFDLWFLNLFPREKPFDGHAYSTLNFVPSFVTMLMGLMAGQLLKNGETSGGQKVKMLTTAAIILWIVGAILGVTICPVVKKLWSPSWALFSGGYAIGLLAIFYWIIDVKKWNKWVFPFVIVGLNPLAMYLMGMLSKGFVRANLHRHLPDFVFVGPAAPIVEACLIALIFWLVLWWMFRNKVFLRL
jgi:predicted acyltransferase